MSLIHEALKRADAERSQRSYSPPPIDASVPKAAVARPRRRRRRPGNWTRNACVIALLVLCSVAGAWSVWTFAGGSPGPKVAYGIQQRIPAPPHTHSPGPQETPEASPAEPSLSTPPQPTTRDARPDKAPTAPETVTPETPEAPEPLAPETPALRPEELASARHQWQQVLADSGQTLRNLAEAGLAAGDKANLFLQDTAAFLSARRRAQEELARQIQEKRRLERRRAEEARIAAEEARKEEARKEKARQEARRRAAEKARAREQQRQEELRKAQLAQQKAREQAQARARLEAAKAASTQVDADDPPETSADQEDSKPEFVLNGILFSYDRIDAVINNKSYQLNETVNGAKVIHIERTMVKLLHDGEIIVLRL
jgi:hypothetical protein